MNNYYKNGKLHRLDGPAVTYEDGAAEWFKNGKLHRDDGPAVIYANGDEEWYKNGKRHRTSGPAVMFNELDWIAWWVNGKRCTSTEEFRERSKVIDEEFTLLVLKYGEIR